MNYLIITIRSRVLPKICMSQSCRVLLAMLAAGVLCPSNTQAQPVTSLKVMTYNIYIGGAAYGPLSRTVGVIQAAQADVIGIQEVGGSAQAIANSLGFYYHGFDSDLAIISRYPITQVLNEGVRLHHFPHAGRLSVQCASHSVSLSAVRYSRRFHNH